MTAQDQVAKLNHLLERVRLNAAQPRTLQPRATRTALFASPEMAAQGTDRGVVDRAASTGRDPAGVARPQAGYPREAASEPAARTAGSGDAITDLDLDDIVDITELPPEEAELVQAEADAAGELDGGSSPPPMSSRRPKLQGDRSSTGVAKDWEAPQIPGPQTPPPQSGRQIALPPGASLLAPALPKEALLGTVGFQSLPGDRVGGSEVPPAVPPPLAAPAHVSSVPAPMSSGRPSTPAAPERGSRPPVAIAPDHVQVAVAPIAPMVPEIPASDEPGTAAKGSALPETTAATAAASTGVPRIEEEILARPLVAASVTVVVAPALAFRPHTFLELLDASLGLRGE